MKPAAPEPALQLLVDRERSPWRGYTASPEQEAAGKHVAAVADLGGFEAPAHLAKYEVAGKPLLAVDRARGRVVVAAAHFSDLDRGDATKLEAGRSQAMGTVRSAALRERPRQLALFLLESQLVETYWHIEARLRLVGEEDSPERYRASFAGHHVYFTNEENEAPLAFALTLDKASGAIAVVGE